MRMYESIQPLKESFELWLEKPNNSSVLSLKLKSSNLDGAKKEIESLNDKLNDTESLSAMRRIIPKFAEGDNLILKDISESKEYLFTGEWEILREGHTVPQVKSRNGKIYKLKQKLKIMWGGKIVVVFIEDIDSDEGIRITDISNSSKFDYVSPEELDEMADILMKFYESPYNHPDSEDMKSMKDVVADTSDPLSRQTFPSRFAIGDKVKFRIGPNAEVDAYIYATRFEAATVWYDILLDPYVGTPDEGGYTILTNVRSLMIHPNEFQERAQRITESQARSIKMRMYKRIKENSKETLSHVRKYKDHLTDALKMTYENTSTAERISNMIESYIFSVIKNKTPVHEVEKKLKI